MPQEATQTSSPGVPPGGAVPCFIPFVFENEGVTGGSCFGVFFLKHIRNHEHVSKTVCPSLPQHYSSKCAEAHGSPWEHGQQRERVRISQSGVPPGGGRPLLEVVFLKCIGLQLVPCCLCCLRVLHACTKQLLRPVVRVLLLLHLPRFPFHDSTGFENHCISVGKP